MGKAIKRGAEEEKAPKSCQECKRWKEAKENIRAVRLMEVLSATVQKIEDGIKANAFKPTVGDYMKLMQMEKDLEEVQEQAKEIRVQWVEPTGSESEE